MSNLNTALRAYTHLPQWTWQLRAPPPPCKDLSLSLDSSLNPHLIPL